MADFRLVALDPARVAALFTLDDTVLQRHAARWVTVDSHPGYPCRISLEDAAIGERLLLLHYPHHDVAGPYRGAGPIYLRRDATAALPAVNVLPESLRRRWLSLRGYDAAGTMIATALTEGEKAAPVIAALLDNPAVTTLHVHNARAGCFACAVERV